MSEEKHLLEALAEGRDMDSSLTGRRARRHREMEGKNQRAINAFLGNGKRTHEVAILPRYYGELLTWALKRYLDGEGWQVIQTMGYHGHEPVFIDVNTDYDRRENLLMDGQLLVQKDDIRLIVTVDINMQWRNSVLAEGAAKGKEKVTNFIAGVLEIAHEQNFYRGKKIEFAGRLRLLDVIGRSWESITVDDAIRREIEANTVSFLRRRQEWEKYGIPPKRGILLSGEPGTGKTVICKALMAEAEGITCITTTAYALAADEYVTELYELAQDLSPSLVFIEDIDLIGQNREESGYQRGPALLALLAVLDGIEEKKEIVTIATTNCLDALDKALSERPSRFDRVIKLSRPSAEQRLELIRRLCHRIPLDSANQDYLARRTEGCTPAQVQEIVYSLALENSGDISGPDQGFTRDMIDRAISRIDSRSRPIGFGLPGNHNGSKNGQKQAIGSMAGRLEPLQPA